MIATHIDKEHCHNHIIFNAVNYVDFHAYRSNKRTYRELRQLSDEICKEHGLSVVPPSQNKGMGYKEYTEAKRGTSWKQKLKQTIDRLVITAKDYDDFLRLMQEAGYEIKTGKYISFRAEGQERFTRSKTIGENYTEERIKERIAGRAPRRSQRQTTPKDISLIGDIQKRIRLIDSKGYEHTSDLYRMDAYYRHFHYAFGNSLKNANDILEDGLKHSTEFVEALYQNWFLRELTACWTNAAAEDLATLGYISEIEKQRDFYKRYVAPSSSKNTRAFVIISDALRYEVASELSERIVRNTKGTAELESMQAVFPSITKFGMAALLPGKSISVNDSMDVLVDGNPTRSTVERNAILNSTPKASVVIQYNDLLNMKKDERRELVAGKDVIYIYHNSIDAIGDKAPTESKVFDACETAIQELSGVLRIIVNELSGTNIFITADHGFLYTYKPLSESDKIDRKTFYGDVYELGRRYALTAPDTTADFLLPVNLERELDGTPIKGYAPQDTIRMKVQGGGENYVHGGISLQELVVPVIAFKNLRTSNKNYVEVKNAELKLLSESRKISNLIFSLEFHQRQPVGDKIQPCTYSIYMTDDEGVVISDRQTVIADKTSDNAADRVFRVRFNLKAGTYDKKKVYRLVITNEIDVEEIEFHIDIAFADDFGFDL